MARNVITPGGKSYRIEGLAQVISNVNEVVSRLEIKEMQQASREAKAVYLQAAEVVATEIRDLAPYDDKRTSGVHLRDAVFVSPGDPKKQNVLVGMNRRKAPHAGLVEHGTSNRSTKSGANRGEMPAHPYLRPAVTTSRSMVVRIVADGLKALIVK